MKIAVIGGGPGGLYFSILMKREDPDHEIVVYERNRLADTFGFGVVFSDATIAEIASADPDTYAAITEHFVRWDDIDIWYKGELLRSTGHGFAGMSRQKLLAVLQERAVALGVRIEAEAEVNDLSRFADADLIVGADGANSTVRELLADRFEPTIDWRPNRFVWLGTSKPFPAFTFYFRGNEHGLWRVHAYQYEADRSTFIVECTEETWHAAGMDLASEEETAAYCAELFAAELDGHELITNRSLWRRFPTVRCHSWATHHPYRVVLLGDAAHTAHFSVGSGTRMAIMDAIALHEALTEYGSDGSDELSVADWLLFQLAVYQADRRGPVESLQRAAQSSLEWFEGTERYFDLEPIQFAFTLLTRSLRITHEDLRVRDPKFTGEVDRWVARRATAQSGRPAAIGKPWDEEPEDEQDRGPRRYRATPPMFTPFKLRDMVLDNRIGVSPMCQYCAVDGTVGDWHLQHLGSRAVGGAGLVCGEMTDVSADARISPGCAGLYKPEHVGAGKRIVDFVHANSVAKISIQLGHAGRKGATKLMWEGDNEPLEAGGWELISASPIPYLPAQSQTPREMTRDDMDGVVAEFVRATEYAIEAGFDMLEIHMAHGYLLASFISPLTNERDDEYGGSLDNRLRFPLEVFDACRAVWPDERPMSVRVSAVDWLPGGMQPEDTVEVARALAAHDCDIVDVSAGQTVHDQEPVYGRLFQTPFADRVRHEVGIATMTVGNVSSWMDANTIIAAGRADLCLLARAHLFDPYWTRHAAAMQDWDLEWPDQYKSVERYTPRFEFHFGGEK